ncbi:MAG: tetratricopeptide repeat protein [Prevotellaceae bacterium]|jgi:tetratricopeptide (TPR) repeat protein|nr:tetratricopeptide repeat protein [Prevotellaceae bacterium]
MKPKRALFIPLLLFVSGGWLYAQYDKQQFFFRGRQNLMEGKYSQAIENFNMLTRMDTTLYEAFFFRGIAKYNLSDFIGAQVDFDRTLRINPVFTHGYHYRAITLSRMGKYEEALTDLEEAVALRPGYTGLFFSRGVTYLLSQQFDKAVSDFNRFIKFEPRVSEAYLNRGASYLYLNDTIKALDDYNTAVLLNKFDPEGYIRRSRVYVLQERYDEALSDLSNAITLDSTNTFAYFNRALVYNSMKNIGGALSDFDQVLKHDPDNALTRYNRALIRQQIGDYENALLDYDRVLEVNPNNVLAYYNRAALFIETGRYRDAIADYTRAIDLYPDFANAYMNRSYVKYQMGQYASAQDDREVAKRKVQEHALSAFADTTQRFDKLLALDADFAKRDFNNDLLQYRDVDIRIKPLYKLLAGVAERPINLEHSYYYPNLERFIQEQPISVALFSVSPTTLLQTMEREDELLIGHLKEDQSPNLLFSKGIIDFQNKQFNSALSYYNQAINKEPNNLFFYINRGALQSEMIEFISSMDSNVQVLTLDDAGTTRARVQEQTRHSYDYSAAVKDMETAAAIAPDFAYVHYNLGNLYRLSDRMPESINAYTKAIELYPYLAEAYYNRGLIQIYLKDKEKGCIDVSTAGELGVKDAYSVIKKYCVSAE